MSWVDDFDPGHDAMLEEPAMRGYGDATFDAPGGDDVPYKVATKCVYCGGPPWHPEHWKCAGAWARRVLEGLREGGTTNGK